MHTLTFEATAQNVEVNLALRDKRFVSRTQKLKNTIIISISYRINHLYYQHHHGRMLPPNTNTSTKTQTPDTQESSAISPHEKRATDALAKER
jgi:hypothetical protein